MSYTIHQEAEQDLREAAKFYREHAGNGLAQLLFDEFEYTLKLLVRQPELGASWQHDARRFVMRRFPYSVIYSIEHGEVRILAVAHQRRNPEYWKERK